MRSNEERVTAVRRRVAQIERQKRHRKNRIIAVAACLVVIVGASFALPGISEKMIIGGYAGYETAASIFSDSAAVGYIIIGLLAFVLGVCVTVLCFKLRKFQKKDEETEDGNDRVH